MSAQATALQTFVSCSSDESSPDRPRRARVAAGTVPLRCAGRANDEGRLAGNRTSARDAESRYAGRIYAAVAT